MDNFDENMLLAKANNLFHSRPIGQYELDGTFIRYWNSAKQVEDELGYNYNNINAYCRNKRNTANGYVWKYKNEETKNGKI